MRPSRTYLIVAKCRVSARGTEMQKHKQRVTIFMCINADGSHAFPVYYAEKAKTAMCLRPSEYKHLQCNYWSQSNGRMDASGFGYWLKIWYAEVRKKSEGPWCLSMDNCGGRAATIAYHRLKVVFLPKKSTAKHQTLDLEIIAHAKIRYGSTLLKFVISVMEKRWLTNEKFHNGSSNGNYGIREGQLPHVADAIVMFNDAWSEVSRVTVLKYWVKIQCLGEQHTQYLNSLIENFTAVDDIDIDRTIPESRMSNESYYVLILNFQIRLALRIVCYLGLIV